MIDETRSKFVHASEMRQASIQAKGRCTLEELTADVLSSELGFLLMDCEANEEQLLTASIREPLARWQILLEVHDFQAPRACESILELYSSTHDVTIINSSKPDRSTLAAIALWPLNALCLDAFQDMFDEGSGGSMRFFSFMAKHQT